MFLTWHKARHVVWLQNLACRAILLLVHLKHRSRTQTSCAMSIYCLKRRAKAMQTHRMRFEMGAQNFDMFLAIFAVSST
jgi:hypothetical protein